jgi:hypothetical protein
MGSGLMSIGDIRLAELGTHPLLLPAELDPEREEEESENDEPAHLGDGNRHAKETGQNAGVDGVAGHPIGTGGDQLVALLIEPVLLAALTQKCRGRPQSGSLTVKISGAPSAGEIIIQII